MQERGFVPKAATTHEGLTLTIDLDRDNYGGTGLFIRAIDPRTDKYSTYDIAALDARSLLAWLRSRGGDNPWAEDVVGLLLGHGHLHGRSPDGGRVVSGSRLED